TGDGRSASMSAVAERYETLTNAFEALRRDPAFGPDWLASARQAAFHRFLERGFPTTRDEEWRFTPIAPIPELKLTRPAAAAPARDALAPYLFDGLATIVVVNGRVSKALSALGSLPAGVVVQTMEHAHTVTPDVRRRSFSGAAPNAFADLNSAFFEDLVTIRIAPKTIVDRPLHVLSIAAPGAQPGLIAPRLAIEVGEEAQVTVIESYATIGQGAAVVAA